MAITSGSSRYGCWQKLNMLSPSSDLAASWSCSGSHDLFLLSDQQMKSAARSTASTKPST